MDLLCGMHAAAPCSHTKQHKKTRTFF